MTLEAVKTMIDQALLRISGGRDGSHSSHAENPRNMHIARPCYYANFIKCHPLNFKGTEGAAGLTRWIEKMEFVFNISGCVVENQKLRTYAERKFDSKRKADDISRNNQQPFKRQNVAKAYNLGSAIGGTILEISSEDPYEEAAQQLFEQAPHSPEYVPRDLVPVFVPEFEHPEDLVPAEDKALASLLPPGFLSPRIRPLSPRALGAKMNDIASSLYHSLHLSCTPPLLPIHLSTTSTSRRARILEADTPPWNRLLLATPGPGCEVGESSAAAARRPRPTMAHGVDCSYVETRLRDTKRRMMAALELVNLRDRAVVRAEIEVLRSERLAYEQEGIQTREALAKSEAYCRALEARVVVLETHARRLEWQRQAVDDFVVQHNMRTQALEAGARDDTLEDTGDHCTKQIIQIMARTRRGQTPPPTNPNNSNNMTLEVMQTMIDQALLRNSNGGDGSHNSHAENPRNMHTARPSYYADFMKCHLLNFKGTEGAVGLTRWIEKMEFVFNISGDSLEFCTRHHDAQKDRAAVRAEIERQAADDLAVQHIMRTQDLEAGARDDTLEDTEVKKLEIELWNLKVRDNNIPAYTNHFQEMALICTKFVSNETEKVDKYISGLPDNIYGNVKSSKPKSLDETIELANDLMDQKLRTCAERKSDSKRNADDISRNNQQPFKRQNVAKAYNLGSAEKKTNEGNAPKCTKSTGNTNATNNRGGNGPNPRGNGCVECGDPGHFKRDCPKLKNKNGGNGNAQGWENGNAAGNPDSNVVTGTFLLNNRYASILFDTGDDRSYVSTAFSSLIDIIPTPLDNHYDVELADGKIVGINTIIRGCTLNFLNHPFTIDLMPVELGSFDAIIGMDWLRKHHAVIVCDEKLVRVPFGNETLVFHGAECYIERESRLTISATKEDDKPEGKQVKDVPIVQDFPEDFPGLPPARPVEFQIDLISGAAPVARAPYCLAPSEMKELSEQLQELSDKGFIRPSSLPWGAPVLFVKKKDGSFRMCINYRELNKLT
nr:hypothetical protein [Tanacetum cinerariifolium]